MTLDERKALTKVSTCKPLTTIPRRTAHALYARQQETNQESIIRGKGHLQTQGNTTAIATALERTTMQFADALQQTIQMGVDAQAQENKNARMDKQFEKVKVFDGSKPSECHPWLEEVHALCIQTGRPFREMLLLCAGQAVHNFITDMSP